MSDEQQPAWAAAMESRLNGSLATIRATIMERIDRLQARVDEHAKRIEGAIALATAADHTGAGADIASLERDLARARTQAALSAAIGTLQQQVAALEERLNAMGRHA